ncbi:unnamed protein product [Polarella glacialis]|uniref:Protochlorophyllide reductase n=1 Tax=Polarella glacialis TaxID=89957 RepID=A0A813KHS2_POLGL|nr:unnamed protein product [Polarella glacialis]
MASSLLFPGMLTLIYLVLPMLRKSSLFVVLEPRAVVSKIQDVKLPTEQKLSAGLVRVVGVGGNIWSPTTESISAGPSLACMLCIGLGWAVNRTDRSRYHRGLRNVLAFGGSSGQIRLHKTPGARAGRGIPIPVRSTISLRAEAAPSSSRLQGKIAVVTGASRGVGRGCAVALGEAGMLVYLTGRSKPDLESTAQAVRRAGGEAVVVLCDHTNDQQTEAVFKQVREEQGRLNVLVCNAYQQAGDETDRLIDQGVKFNGLPLDLYDKMNVGPRACYACSYFAADLLRETARNSGIGDASPLVAFIGGFGAISPAARPWLSTAYAVSKAAVDRLARDLNAELGLGLGPQGPEVVVLYPGIVFTERVAQMCREGSSEMDRITGGLPAETLCESPLLTGRVAAALAAEPALRTKPLVDGPGIHDRVAVVAEVARSLGIQDGGSLGSVAAELYGAARPPAPSLRSLGYLGPTILRSLPDFLKLLADVGGPLANPDWKLPLEFMSQGDVAET